MKVTKQNLHCLRYLGRLVIGLTIFFSCANHSVKTPENQFKVLEKYFAVNHKFQLNKNISEILILSDQGCITCNKSFANILSQRINNPHLLLVITASGNAVDLSKFIENKSENIFYDYKAEVSDLLNLKGSGIISISDQKVDTIIVLDAIHLKANLDYFISRTIQ
jgi:hypothetical protein